MFAADDAVYIADTGNNRIVVFDITGEHYLMTG